MCENTDKYMKGMQQLNFAQNPTGIKQQRNFQICRFLVLICLFTFTMTGDTVDGRDLKDYPLADQKEPSEDECSGVLMDRTLNAFLNRSLACPRIRLINLCSIAP